MLGLQTFVESVCAASFLRIVAEKKPFFIIDLAPNGEMRPFLPILWWHFLLKAKGFYSTFKKERALCSYIS